VATANVDGGWLIRVAGELDLLTAAGLGELLRAAIDAAAGCRAWLDLAKVRFVDAVGLAVLLDAAAYARARRCRMDVIGARAQVARIIEITGTGRALGVA
jgi:stage II sporulation protein AA (anti-sigma F factor antagonist)